MATAEASSIYKNVKGREVNTLIQGWNAVRYKKEGWHYVLDDKKPIVLGREKGNQDIKVKNAEGHTLLKWKSSCVHTDDSCHSSYMKSQAKVYVAEACNKCRRIHIYNLATQKITTKFPLGGIHPNSMCQGPGGDSLLILDNTARAITQLRWMSDLEILEEEQSITLPGELHVCDIHCHIKENDSVVMVERSKSNDEATYTQKEQNNDYIIHSMGLSSGTILWHHYGRNLQTQTRTPTRCHGLHYSDGQLFICERPRMLIINVITGKVEKTVSKEQIDSLEGLMWNLHLAHMKTTSRRHITTIQVDTSDKELEFINKNLDAYIRACEEGEARLNHARLMVTGCHGDGKSSFIKRLIGESINEDHIPTNALESDLCCDVNITRCNEAWSKLVKDRGEVIEGDLTLGISEVLRENWVVYGEHGDQEMETDAIGDVILDQRPTENEGVNRGSSELTGDHPSADNVSISSGSSKTSTTVRKKTPTTEEVRMLKRVKRLSDNEDNNNQSDSQRDENHSLINIWDFAGQVMFYILHPIFFRARCLYILVINLSIKLDTKVRSLQSTSEQEQKYSECIIFWLNMILSHLGKNQSSEAQGKVILVGTHKDLLHKDKDKQKKLANEYFKKLKAMLENKEHQILIHTCFAVDSKGGDPETYEKVRAELLSSFSTHCKWGEKRPIRWLRLQRKLHSLQADGSLTQPERYLLRFQDVLEHAKEYNIHGEDDVKLFLQFSHLSGDLTYFEADGLRDFVVTNPQWLVNVFRAIITLDEYYPDDPRVKQDLKKLKSNGLLKKDGPLLEALWGEFLITSDANRKQDIISYLLKLMAQFDLVIHHTDKNFLVPSLLPLSTETSRSLFSDMISMVPPLFFRFHSSLESHEDFLEGSETYDHFLPVGLFQRLISRCVKIGWRWGDYKFQDLVSFLVGDSVIVLSTRSTWIKLEVLIPSNDVTVQLSEISINIMAEILAMLESYNPNMWYEFCVNPCESLGEECIIPTGNSSLSLNAANVLVRCPHHKRSLTSNQFEIWFVSRKCRALCQKDIVNLSKELTTEEKLTYLAAELNIDLSDIAAALQNKTEIRMASLDVLNGWFEQQINKMEAYFAMSSALKEANLGGLINTCLKND